MDVNEWIDDTLTDLYDLVRALKDPEDIPYVERAILEMEQLRKQIESR